MTAQAPTTQHSRRGARPGRFWMMFPFVLLGLMLAGWGYMVSVALDDPSFSVEKNYYEKAVSWDEHQAQQAQNRALGWKLSNRLEAQGKDMRLTVTILDRRGVELRGARVAASAFHIARGANVLQATLSDRGDGSYVAVLPMRRPGIWELRFLVEHDGQRFTAVQREELVVKDPP